MAEIVSLDTIRGQRTPDPLRNMVEEMEDLLRLAKSGELKGFCFGAITEDGHRALCGFLRTTACNDMELLGLICTSTSPTRLVDELPACKRNEPPQRLNSLHGSARAT